MGSGHRFRCAVNFAAALFPFDIMSLVVPQTIVTPLGFALDRRCRSCMDRRCRSFEFSLDRRRRSCHLALLDLRRRSSLGRRRSLRSTLDRRSADRRPRLESWEAAAAAGMSISPLDKPQLHLQPHKALGRLMCELALLTASAWSSLQSAERVTNTGLGPALAHMIVASLNDRIGNGQDVFQPQDEAAWLDAISEVHRR